MDDTGIPWCDGTCNPGMGCSGLCEMWPTNGKVRNTVINKIVSLFTTIPPDRVEAIVKRVLQDYAGTNLYANRDAHIYDIESAVVTAWPAIAVGLSIRGVYERLFKCFAGKLVTMRAGHAGYPASFEVPIIFEGCMAEAARQSSLHGQSRAAKPWLNGCRRLVFISDMGDVLSREIPFEYLKQEIIDQVMSENGLQHMWLWLSKNPKRMVEFDRWLENQGVDWPEHLMAMTTVTSNDTAYRIDTLRKVRAKLKGLSVEPLWEAVTLNLADIDWCIVGGESGARANAEPFDLGLGSLFASAVRVGRNQLLSQATWLQCCPSRIYPELRYVWCAPATYGGMLPNGDTELRARLIATIAAREFGITITYNPKFRGNPWRYREYHWGSLPTLFEIEGLTDDREGMVPLLYVCLD